MTEKKKTKKNINEWCTAPLSPFQHLLRVHGDKYLDDEAVKTHAKECHYCFFVMSMKNVAKLLRKSKKVEEKPREASLYLRTRGTVLRMAKVSEIITDNPYRLENDLLQGISFEKMKEDVEALRAILVMYTVLVIQEVKTEYEKNPNMPDVLKMPIELERCLKSSCTEVFTHQEIKTEFYSTVELMALCRILGILYSAIRGRECYREITVQMIVMAQYMYEVPLPDEWNWILEEFPQAQMQKKSEQDKIISALLGVVFDRKHMHPKMLKRLVKCNPELIAKEKAHQEQKARELREKIQNFLKKYTDLDQLTEYIFGYLTKVEE